MAYDDENELDRWVAEVRGDRFDAVAKTLGMSSNNLFDIVEAAPDPENLKNILMYAHQDGTKKKRLFDILAAGMSREGRELAAWMGGLR
ncbi:hypothetical protein [Bradyrhizobium jicamae]|uniref:hypothetical protein n=1 Tax=Bradyrhizobium jicamae TaxID=280332 RepID=UPI001BAC45BD|nr:hypothetical protein [Bradyrhizobium jicamae]MBR0937549.1 hypothetical protein [Bradyrhizobium jicamae]